MILLVYLFGDWKELLGVGVWKPHSVIWEKNLGGKIHQGALICFKGFFFVFLEGLWHWDVMDRRVVLDLETKKTFDEVGGREHIDQLEVTVVGIYDYASNEYRIYEEHEMGQLQNFLINSSLIIGFNHLGFDMPVLQPYFSVDVKELPCFDIMTDFQEKVGHRIGLDSIAQATLGIGKTGHGLDAIRYYREGKIKELKEYCINDVKVTREIFDYGIENGKIYYLSRFGKQKKEVSVSDWKKYRNSRKLAQTKTEGQYKLF